MLFDAPQFSFDELWYSCPTFVAVHTKCNWNEKKMGKKIHDSFVLVEDTLTIDMRAKCAVDAITDFKNDLIYCSRILCLLYPLRYLNVIVGCKEHGVGKGKLKQAVIDVLEKEKDLKWREEFEEGSVVSIELDVLEMEVHASNEKVKIFPCTAICDFLFDLPKSSFDRVWDMCPRLEEELYKCCRDEEIYGEKLYGSYFLAKNTFPVDLRANCAVDAVEAVKRHLYFCSLLFAISCGRSLRSLDFVVGCRVHGVGQGKLKQRVIDVLEMEDDLEWSEKCVGGSVISAKLDGRKNFNFLLGENVVLPSFISRLLT